MKNMESTLYKTLHNFKLDEALELSDKMQSINEQRTLTPYEETYWLKLVVKIESMRGNCVYFQ